MPLGLLITRTLQSPPPTTPSHPPPPTPQRQRLSVHSSPRSTKSRDQHVLRVILQSNPNQLSGYAIRRSSVPLSALIEPLDLCGVTRPKSKNMTTASRPSNTKRNKRIIYSKQACGPPMPKLTTAGFSIRHELKKTIRAETKKEKEAKTCCVPAFIWEGGGYGESMVQQGRARLPDLFQFLSDFLLPAWEGRAYGLETRLWMLKAAGCMVRKR
ncbi:hypothetical protein GQ44DRAFT_424597 [Phaeosphaeriaceae sp. PMI808]|nr:hypothetical protein GQ44DRAFT_424597 [Phaeosphaeriaceae sp. PMI808]